MFRCLGGFFFFFFFFAKKLFFPVSSSFRPPPKLSLNLLCYFIYLTCPFPLFPFSFPLSLSAFPFSPFPFRFSLFHHHLNFILSPFPTILLLLFRLPTFGGGGMGWGQMRERERGWGERVFPEGRCCGLWMYVIRQCYFIGVVRGGGNRCRNPIIYIYTVLSSEHPKACMRTRVS